MTPRAGESGAAGDPPVRLHASCVAWESHGVLILGPSASGKSGLALSLMGLGATLVSDDQVIVALRDGWPTASAPQTLGGMIEARGIGILRAASLPSVRVTLVVDMGTLETDRLPPERHHDLCGRRLPLIHKVDTPYFAAGILQYLRGGRADI